MPQINTVTISRNAHRWLQDTAIANDIGAYIDHLIGKGYASTTVSHYVNAVAHFTYWLGKQSICLEAVDEHVVSCFLKEHLPVCQCASRCHRATTEVRAALARWLELLRIEGLIAEKKPTASAPIAAELAEFDDYLANVRGLQSTTRLTRSQQVSAFLVWHFGSHPVVIEQLEPTDIVGFFTAYTARWKPSSIQVVCSSVRSYLRFKAVFGYPTTALIAAIPKVAHWRSATLPKTLSDDEVQQLLDACDRQTSAGRRDYAIMRCHIDLGLRATEVVRLELDDINWQQGVIQIRGKGRRTDGLPLPVKTGQAIVDYLRHGRRASSTRALFLRHRPPHDKPASTATIQAVVSNAAQRCGLARRINGPHVLRHTVATRLINNGATLKEIADLLRHRSLDTTTIYAKVDFDAQAAVAAPWPGSRT